MSEVTATTTCHYEPKMATTTIISGKNGQLIAYVCEDSGEVAALLAPAGFDWPAVTLSDVKFIDDIWTMPFSPLESIETAVIAYEMTCEYVGADPVYPMPMLSIGGYMNRIRAVLGG